MEIFENHQKQHYSLETTTNLYNPFDFSPSISKMAGKSLASLMELQLLKLGV